MKRDALIKSVLAGVPLVVAEYRGREAEDRNWKDRESGAMTSGTFCHDNIEIGRKPVKVGVRLPDGVRAGGPETKDAFPLGSAVVLRLSSLDATMGNLKATGLLEVLTD